MFRPKTLCAQARAAIINIVYKSDTPQSTPKIDSNTRKQRAEVNKDEHQSSLCGNCLLGSCCRQYNFARSVQVDRYTLFSPPIILPWPLTLTTRCAITFCSCGHSVHNLKRRRVSCLNAECVCEKARR